MLTPRVRRAGRHGMMKGVRPPVCCRCAWRGAAATVSTMHAHLQRLAGADRLKRTGVRIPYAAHHMIDSSIAVGRAGAATERASSARLCHWREASVTHRREAVTRSDLTCRPELTHAAWIVMNAPASKLEAPPDPRSPITTPRQRSPMAASETRRTPADRRAIDRAMTAILAPRPQEAVRD
jgi:hypothetical protein